MKKKKNVISYKTKLLKLENGGKILQLVLCKESRKVRTY